MSHESFRSTLVSGLLVGVLAFGPTACGSPERANAVPVDALDRVKIAGITNALDRNFTAEYVGPFDPRCMVPLYQSGHDLGQRGYPLEEDSTGTGNKRVTDYGNL
jgi:hypothetical protein